MEERLAEELWLDRMAGSPSCPPHPHNGTTGTGKWRWTVVSPGPAPPLASLAGTWPQCCQKEALSPKAMAARGARVRHN